MSNVSDRCAVRDGCGRSVCLRLGVIKSFGGETSVAWAFQAIVAWFRSTFAIGNGGYACAAPVVVHVDVGMDGVAVVGCTPTNGASEGNGGRGMEDDNR